MRRLAVAAGVVIVAAAGAIAVMLVLNARDEPDVHPVAGPGVERVAGARPVVGPGNIVLLFSDERETAALRKFALDAGGPATPAVAAAGQAVIARHQIGLRVPVVAITSHRRLNANGPGDPRLRAFVEYWLGREAPR